jgi:hypothetical protein
MTWLGVGGRPGGWAGWPDRGPRLGWEVTPVTVVQNDGEGSSLDSAAVLIMGSASSGKSIEASISCCQLFY